MAHAPVYETPVVFGSSNNFATSCYKYEQIPKHCMQTYM